MPDFSNLRCANIFATPLLTDTWADAERVNPVLRENILAHEQAHPGVDKSNRGGWHSETGQIEFCGKAGQDLIGYLLNFANEATDRVALHHNEKPRRIKWSLTAWVNVSRNGDFNKIHVHPNSTWSGTYYVDAGDPEDQDVGTPIHLFDPCQGRSMTFAHIAPSSVYIKPRAGLIIMFPSYVPHMVFPHAGKGERISIAFNLSIDRNLGRSTP